MTEQAVTLRDVAARAGVHPATASRALNPETRLLVKEDTARRVLEAAEQLGYHPNPVARSLRTRRSSLRTRWWVAETDSPVWRARSVKLIRPSLASSERILRSISSTPSR